jgi:hypothetical protein
MSLWGGFGGMGRRDAAASAAAADVASGLGDSHQSHEIELLTYQVERLALACEAMWLLLSERLGVTGEQLAQRVHDLDAGDGTIDGRHTQLARHCPRCDAAVSADSPKCQFCGAEAPNTNPFAV